jgi:lipopolysaccharide export system protein LptC
VPAARNSAAPVQVQGPFGTLTATNGFLLLDRGADIMFNGPATLTLIQAQ